MTWLALYNSLHLPRPAVSAFAATSRPRPARADSVALTRRAPRLAPLFSTFTPLTSAAARGLHSSTYQVKPSCIHH
jgi:hypothetical protein